LQDSGISAKGSAVATTVAPTFHYSHMCMLFMRTEMGTWEAVMKKGMYVDDCMYMYVYLHMCTLFVRREMGSWEANIQERCVDDCMYMYMYM
jgi:hypothetical protein